MRVRAGSGAVSGRDVFSSTADSEIWLVDRDDPLLDRADPYARRVFRDPHPLDNDPTRRFDDGNGQRILLGSMGVKAAAGDSAALLPPAHTFDTLRADAVGGVYYSFEKYGVQVERAEFAAGADPSTNNPPSRPTGRRSSRSPPTTWRTCTTSATTRSTAATSPATPAARASSPPFDYVPAQRGGLPRAAGRARRPDRHATCTHRT